AGAGGRRDGFPRPVRARRPPAPHRGNARAARRPCDGARRLARRATADHEGRVHWAAGPAREVDHGGGRMTPLEVAADLVVTLEYTVRLESGRLVDSTGQCGPMAIMIGAGQLFPALEDRIAGMRAGETREVRIPPE